MDRVQRLPLRFGLPLLAVLATGIWLAVHLVGVKLRLELDPTYVSSCNIDATLNCDAVQTSDYATVLGYPLALHGATAYGILLAAALVALAWARGARALVAGIGLVAAAACAHTLYLAYLSSFVIGSYCIYCLGMYGVNLATLGLAVAASRRLAGRWFEPVALLRSPAAMAGLVAAAGLGAFVAIRGYEATRARMTEERLEVAKAEVAAWAAEEDAVEEEAPQEPAGAAAASPPVAAAPAPPVATTTAAAIATAPQPPTVGGPVTRKGRSRFDVPIAPDDFVLGAADAKVTIVEFADFQCGYCRVLTRNFEPLKKKYADRVRWVFKHFPMDNTCNKAIKDVQHPQACAAARAANCAGDQGKFWEMHDILYARSGLDSAQLEAHAKEAGVELGAWKACIARTEPDARIVRDSELGRLARINGTPRMFINGRLVSGVQATEVLEYYIQAALERAKEAPAAPAEVRDAMVSVPASTTPLWIDAYEASIDDTGRATARPGVIPARASWFQARDACAKAGKRLCTEPEWITACSGAVPVDDDNDGAYTDDAVEGRLYPYGAFHEGGICYDNDPDGKPTARAAGSAPRCRTPEGAHDLAGNLAEWVGDSEASAVLLGADSSYGQRASCYERYKSFGPGYRNQATGFRCCAGAPVAASEGKLVDLPLIEVGHSAPPFSVPKASGAPVTERVLTGKVTWVSFFASWCSPCRRELPELQAFHKEQRAKGFEALAINVDTDSEDGRKLAESLGLDFTVAYDPKAVVMGRFGVKGMPTSFLVDRKGVVIHRIVGVGRTEMDGMKAKALEALGHGG